MTSPNPAQSEPTMNKFDFAAGVIKASPLARLTDRAFIAPVLFSCVVWIAALQGKTTIDRAIEFTQWAIGPFVVAEKIKDAVTSYGALVGGTPSTVVAGNDANVVAQPPAMLANDAQEVAEQPVMGIPITGNNEVIDHANAG